MAYTNISPVVYYITSVLTLNVGLTRNLSLLLGGVVNLMFVIGSLLPTFTLDRTGRRKPMMWGSLGCGASMMMIAILLSFKDRGGDLAKATASGSVAFFFTYMLSFGATANCIPWVYVPEILPLHVRAKGTAVGISANWYGFTSLSSLLLNLPPLPYHNHIYHFQSPNFIKRC